MDRLFLCQYKSSSSLAWRFGVWGGTEAAGSSHFGKTVTMAASILFFLAAAVIDTLLLKIQEIQLKTSFVVPSCVATGDCRSCMGAFHTR